MVLEKRKTDEKRREEKGKEVQITYL